MEHVTVQGVEVPALGLGTWGQEGQDCRKTVETALDIGYRHIDTAQTYGNERAVGKAIANASVDREDIFLTTKITASAAGDGDFQSAVEQSLETLDTAYLDLVLLHWPSVTTSFRETARAMADVRDRGLSRHVGVSNFRRWRLKRARAVSSVPLLTDQVQFHPYYPHHSLLEYCQREDVMLTAYSPLARGGILDDDVLTEVGSRYEKSAAQIALRWATQHRNVAAIPKSSSRGHLEENLEIFDFSLDQAEIDRVRQGSYVRTGLAWLKSHLAN
jgi:2,5-diketo-D-gluconate reductase B